MKLKDRKGVVLEIENAQINTVETTHTVSGAVSVQIDLLTGTSVAPQPVERSQRVTIGKQCAANRPRNVCPLEAEPAERACMCCPSASELARRSGVAA